MNKTEKSLDEKIQEALIGFVNSKRARKPNKSRTRGATHGLTVGEIASRVRSNAAAVVDVLVKLKRKGKVIVKGKYWLPAA